MLKHRAVKKEDRETEGQVIYSYLFTLIRSGNFVCPLTNIQAISWC